MSAACLPFISGNIFLPMNDDQTMFSFVISKEKNERGILLFVHGKLVNLVSSSCPQLEG